MFSDVAIEFRPTFCESLDEMRDRKRRQFDARYPCVCVLRETAKAVLFGRERSLAMCWIPRSQFRFVSDEPGLGERADRPNGRDCWYRRWRIEPAAWGRSKLASSGTTDF